MPPQTPLTTRQIAVYGHVAAAIREAMEKAGLTYQEINKRMGRTVGHASIYTYANGKGAPDKNTAAKLSKILGIPASALMRRDPDEVAAVEPPKFLTQRPAAKQPDVLSFTVSADGMTRIRLDAVLPFEKAMPLLRMLSDAGVVFSSGE